MYVCKHVLMCVCMYAMCACMQIYMYRLCGHVCAYLILKYLCMYVSIYPCRVYSMYVCGTWWLIGRFIAFRPKGRGFDSRSSRLVVTLGKFFTRSGALA